MSITDREVARAHSTRNKLVNDIILCSSWSPGLTTGGCEEKHTVTDAQRVLTAEQQGNASGHDPSYDKRGAASADARMTKETVKDWEAMLMVSAAWINWKSCQAKRFYEAFINMLINGWNGGRRGEDASPDEWMDSSWLQTPFQLLSIVHEIRTRWLIIKQTHKVFISEQTNIWLFTVSPLLFPL